jgi:hypothetical protein
MDDLSQRALEVLRNLSFEVQPTSFSDITSTGEMSRIREYNHLPDSDSAQILRYFPDFFLIHHSAPPERGIFFVTLARDDMTLTRKAQDIYQRYFPRDLLIVGQNPKHELVAVWVGSPDEPKPLDEVIHDRLET